MRLDRVERSKNVEDQRGRSVKRTAMGGGLGAIIMALIAMFVFKQNPAEVLGSAGLGGRQGATESAPYTPTADEQEWAEVAQKVLRLTEQVWAEQYPALALAYPGAPQRYQEPVLRLFSGQVQSACGFASAAMGPFYCPGDQRVFIDLAFFDELRKKFGAPGDFAQAYVLAHEVGHHIQNLLGLTTKVDRARGTAQEKQMSVRLELQADYLAGVWAHHAHKKYQVLERGDVEEGLAAANAVGDDRLQKQAQGYAIPDSFTHGSSEQRMRWFTLGFRSGDPLAHDPFKVAYGDL